MKKQDLELNEAGIVVEAPPKPNKPCTCGSGKKWKKCCGKKPGIRPIRNTEPRPGRNSLCPCGSSDKYKRCCGRAPSAATRVSPTNIYQTFRSQLNPEQQEAEKAFIKQWGFIPNPAQLLMFMQGDPSEMKDTVLRAMSSIDADPKFIYAIEELDRLITPKNQYMYSEAEQAEWAAKLAEFVPLITP